MCLHGALWPIWKGSGLLLKLWESDTWESTWPAASYVPVLLLWYDQRSKKIREKRRMVQILSTKYLTFHQPANDCVGAYLAYLISNANRGVARRQITMRAAQCEDDLRGNEGRVSVYTVMLIDLAFPLFKQVGINLNKSTLVEGLVCVGLAVLGRSVQFHKSDYLSKWMLFK